MADVAAFRGLLFDPTAIDELGHVVAPPYDVISAADRDVLEDASPYNVVRLILGRDEPGDDEASNKYMRARALLEAWRGAGVLRRDDRDALYVYEQDFSFAGERRTLRGVFAAVKLDEPAGRGVLPHERTYDDIVEDRLALLRATATNLDPVFGVYDSDDQAAAAAIESVTRAEPAGSCTTPDGNQHRIWRLDDPAGVEAVVRSLDKATVVIADGHHRWRTAGHYRDERRALEGPGPWGAALMFLADVSQSGPALLPIHRVIDGIPLERVRELLAPVFTMEEVTGSPQELADLLAEGRPDGRAFILMGADRAWRLRVADQAAERDALPAERSDAWRDLDVAVLHHLVFDRLLGGVTPRFVHTASEAHEEVEQARATAAFLLAPMPFESVKAVAEAGEAMPQKSTYFVPKPATGLVMRPLD